VAGPRLALRSAVSLEHYHMPGGDSNLIEVHEGGRMQALPRHPVGRKRSR